MGGKRWIPLGIYCVILVGYIDISLFIYLSYFLSNAWQGWQGSTKSTTDSVVESPARHRQIHMEISAALSPLRPKSEYRSTTRTSRPDQVQSAATAQEKKKKKRRGDLGEDQKLRHWLLFEMQITDEARDPYWGLANDW